MPYLALCTQEAILLIIFLKSYQVDMKISSTLFFIQRDLLELKINLKFYVGLIVCMAKTKSYLLSYQVWFQNCRARLRRRLPKAKLIQVATI